MSQTIYIIDDDASLRLALVMTIESIGLRAASFASVQDFLDAATPDLRGVLVLDVRLPGINGLDFQARFGRYGLDMPVIMMTGYGDIPMSVRAMKAGAVDFLAKPFRDQELIDAVSAAIQIENERISDHTDGQKLLELYQKLSAREREVMGHVVAGMLNKQIAFELGISEVTVKIHRAAGMRKMEARSLADLVRAADRLRAHLGSTSVRAASALSAA